MRKSVTGILGLVLLTAIATGCGPVPETPLAQAAAKGDAEQVRALLAQGADPNESGKRGITPLMWAGRAGHVAVVEALLGAGALPDVRDRHVNGWTALVHAIHKNQNGVARVLLAAGADPNLRLDGGTTALMFAAAYGNTEIVRALLEKGADPYAEARGGVTALWNAAGGGAVFDFTDGPSLGSCFPETAGALLERAPDLRLKKTGFGAKVVKTLSGSKECSALIARLQE